MTPAMGLIELDSIAAGLVAADTMVKASPVASIVTGTVHPGRYLVLVTGDTASVDVALDAGRITRPDALVASMFLPDVHPSVAAAVAAGLDRAEVAGDSLGIVETSTVAALIDAADAGVKAANVELAVVRLADGLGGKAYALFTGAIADIEAAIAAATDRAEPTGALLAATVIPQLHPEIRDNLAAELRFNPRVTGD